MRWRALVWAAVAIGVAAAVGLGVDIAMAGLEQASGLAGVIVGFCEIGALVLGVAAWTADRRSSAGAAPASDPAQEKEIGDAPAVEPNESPPGTGKYVISAETIEKSQVGDGNTQHNA